MNLERPRRVLLVETNEDGTVGGSHQCLYDLAVRLDRRSWDPVVLFNQHNRFVDLLRETGIPTHSWDAQRAAEHANRLSRGLLEKLAHTGMVPGAVLRRLRFLRDERIELVHVNNSPRGGSQIWVPAARLAHLPITTHARVTYSIPHRAVERWMTRRFDAVVAISHHVAQSLESGGIPPDQIHTVHDGIDLSRWVPRPPEEGCRLRAKAGVRDDAMLVVLVGHLRPWKGQAVALDAVEALAPALRERVRLWIVGEAAQYDAAYAQDLRRRVHERGLGDVVSFLGFRSDIPELMGAADVVLHASTIPEPFGLVVVEGLALGKVVVASRLGGPAEIVGPGDGLLFDPAHPLELTRLLEGLAADPERRRQLALRARERARAFDVQSTVAGVSAVWAGVVRS